ncbi:hypothetical protein DQ04_09521010 [Trypanosoma grayi]|uniref:hypothetical protein n=1 Tax=Trypanosoma grayi TaxID=71804 RepID=UPI0004F47C8D|nr:hypothetical protein DQ04_09521010 [Trypanosoma grayi]KEG07532.1 hypothetical protein DQ04_09521010 [Trypanosoma grayi]
MIGRLQKINMQSGETIGEVDKVFIAASPVETMVTCGHYVWMALATGAEVRNARSAEPVHGWNTNSQNDKGTGGILSLLTVPTRSKGSQVWMGLSNGSVEAYDAQSFLMVRQLARHAGGVYCLAEFGGYVYSGSSDFKIAQWDAEDGRLVRMLHGHNNYVRCLYAEGSAVVSGSDDCSVRVWDAGSGEAQLTGHFHGRAGVSALCRVGVTMWSGDDAGRVIAWKLSTCEALRVLQAHGGRVASLRKVGSRVYSGGADGIIAVFDAEDGQLLQRVEDHRGGRITALVAPSELRRFCIWSSGTDGMVRCWYHDEYVSMTDDQERFTEGFWYLTGSTPYREFRDSVVKHCNALREKLRVAERENARMLDVVSLSNASLSPSHVQQQEAKLQVEYRFAKERQGIVESDLQKGRETMQRLEKETATVLELLRVAQAELRVLDPTAVFATPGMMVNVNSGATEGSTIPFSSSTRAGGQTLGVSSLPLGVSVPGVGTLPTVPPSGVAGAGTAETLTSQGAPAVPPPLSNSLYEAKPQPYSAITQPLGGTPSTAESAQPSSLVTQPLGSIRFTGATPPLSSAVAQPLGGTASTAESAQPSSLVTQPLGSTRFTGATPPPSSAVAQPLGGTASTAEPAQPSSLVTQPLGSIRFTGATPPPSSAITQPLGGNAAVVGAVATPQPYSSTLQTWGNTGVVPGGVAPQPSTAQGPGVSGAADVLAYPSSGAVGGASATATPAVPSMFPGAVAKPCPVDGAPAGLPPAQVPPREGISLDALARAAAVEGGGGWHGVQWTNKNVGYYIQRRYYGAEPSLRAPALEKRQLRQKRMPSVKVEPRKVKKNTE